MGSIWLSKPLSNLESTVHEALRLNLDPLGYYEPVVAGIEESILTRSKDVGLQKREEEILYAAVMDALRRKWDQLLGTLPKPEPPVRSPEPEQPKAETIVSPALPPTQPEEPEEEVIQRPPERIIRPAAGGYYLHTFLDVGGSDDGRFQNYGDDVMVDPGTAWGYGLAVGRNTGDGIRMELESLLQRSQSAA